MIGYEARYVHERREHVADGETRPGADAGKLEGVPSSFRISSTREEA